MPKIDLTNKSYEFFTVYERNEERTKQNGRNVFWNCKCVCGNIFVATTSDIIRGVRKSCGCKKKELLSQAHLQDITGQRFGRLTVLYRDLSHQYNHKKPRTYWMCQCDCGNIVSVERQHLVCRGQKSCGCLQSIGEFNINQLLSTHHINYCSQYTNQELLTDNNGYLKYDFAIMDEQNNVIRLIEFDGPQHSKNAGIYFNLEEIQKRDKQKNIYAKNKNIPLVRIPYYKRDCITIDTIFGDEFLV